MHTKVFHILHPVEDELLDWDDREQFGNFSCASIGGVVDHAFPV